MTNFDIFPLFLSSVIPRNDNWVGRVRFESCHPYLCLIGLACIHVQVRLFEFGLSIFRVVVESGRVYLGSNPIKLGYWVFDNIQFDYRVCSVH